MSEQIFGGPNCSDYPGSYSIKCNNKVIIKLIPHKEKGKNILVIGVTTDIDLSKFDSSFMNEHFTHIFKFKGKERDTFTGAFFASDNIFKYIGELEETFVLIYEEYCT